MREIMSWGFPSAVRRVEQDYDTLRGDAAQVDLSPLSAFDLVGPDAMRFLQGMITNDVKPLASGEGCAAAILTPIGKIIADLIVLRRSTEAFRIACRGELKEKVINALNRFIITDQVEVQDVAGYAVIGVIGPRSSQRLGRACEALPQKPFDQVEVSLEGMPVLLVRDTRYGLDGYQLWVPGDRRSFYAAWIEQRCGCTAAGPEAFEILRIEAGVPVGGLDYDETNLPLECNLDYALNFKKGCYTGQEIIARATYLGSVSRKLMGLIVKVDRVPVRGEEVSFQDQVIGQVTSAAKSPRLGRPVALAYIQKKFVSAAEVDLKSLGTSAEVHPLPLVPPNL